MKINVYEVSGDWVMYCDTHEVMTTCPDWGLAYEAAAGHAAMEHPRAENVPVEQSAWRMIHEPHCNTACRPGGGHHLSIGVGMPHIHLTDLNADCGSCRGAG